MNPDIIRGRSILCAGIRSFFSSRAYLEVDTPLLAPALIPESAIEIFKTRFEHPYQKPQDMYLIPSPELWMKRLIAQGAGNIFQICKAFRNAESMGKLHNPEFTILEYYTLGANYEDSLRITEELFIHLAQVCKKKIPSAVSGTQLTPPFRRISMAEAFNDYAKLDLESLAPKKSSDSLQAARELTAKARELHLPADETDTWEEAFNRIFVGVVEPSLPQDKPLALINYPREVRCLAKDIPGTPWNERWELYVNGIETINCFTEETDYDKVSAYFREEAELKKNALIPHSPDEEFISIYGKTSSCLSDNKTSFPPCSGAAVGLDRLIMSFLGVSSLGGMILFPFPDILDR